MAYVSQEDLILYVDDITQFNAGEDCDFRLVVFKDYLNSQLALENIDAITVTIFDNVGRRVLSYTHPGIPGKTLSIRLGGDGTSQQKGYIEFTIAGEHSLQFVPDDVYATVGFVWTDYFPGPRTVTTPKIKIGSVQDAIGPNPELPNNIVGQKGEKGDAGVGGGDGGTIVPGPKGEKGERGYVGERGVAGQDGIAGDAGPKGDAGQDGIIGVDGAKGEVGVAGPKGDAGQDGVDGQKGEAGQDGVSPPAQPSQPGQPGQPGQKGEKGAEGRGTVGDKGDVGQKGEAGLDGNAGTGMKGEAGVAGPKGDAGQVGVDGAKGDAGQKGEAGLDGNAGTGVKGEAGVAGQKGEAGVAGSKGDIGDAGSPGQKGEAGSDSTVEGPIGPKGDDGDAGAKGDTGAKGDDGSPGIKGEQGLQGIPGPKGEAGTGGGSGAGVTAYLCKIEFDINNNATDAGTFEDPNSDGKYTTNGATYSKSLSGSQINGLFTFANETSAPISIVAYAFDDQGADGGNPRYAITHLDFGGTQNQYEIIGITPSAEGGGIVGTDLFTNFNNATIKIDLDSTYFELISRPGFPTGMLGHIYIVFTFA